MNGVCNQHVVNKKCMQNFVVKRQEKMSLVELCLIMRVILKRDKRKWVMIMVTGLNWLGIGYTEGA